MIFSSKMTRKYLREISQQSCEPQDDLSDSEQQSQSLLALLDSPLPVIETETFTTVDVNALHNQIFTTDDIPAPKVSKANTSKFRNESQNSKLKRWTWTDGMVEALLHNISSYKSTKEYEGIDFESDLIQLYGDIRKMMAEMYPQEDFGPADVPVQSTDAMTKSEVLIYKRNIEKMEKLKKDGYTRIKNKIKELRRGYKKAIDSGTRSGSGRFIQENFDVLKEIWGGCPAVTSLPGSLSSMQPPSNEQTDIMLLMQQSPSNDQADESDEEETSETDNSERTNSDCSTKRKHSKITDNKRNRLEKKLSAHQRDMLYIDIAREELRLKNAHVEMMKKSFEQTDTAIKAMSESMVAIGDGLKDGLTSLAQSFLQSQQMPNYAYQHPHMFNVIPSPTSPLVSPPTQLPNRKRSNEENI